MAFPPATPEDQRHSEDWRNFYVKSGRWQEALPYYEHTKEWVTAGPDAQYNLWEADAPPPQTFISSTWTFVPRALSEIQFNVMKRNNTWFDWSDPTASADFWGQLRQGGGAWGKVNWPDIAAPNANGAYLNYADGSWKMQLNKLVTLKLDFTAYNANSFCNMNWHLTYNVPDGRSAVVRGGCFMVVHPSNIGAIKLHTTGTIQPVTVRVKAI